MSDQLRCDCCGKFVSLANGVHWKMIYSGGPVPMPDHEIYRCVACVMEFGAFEPQCGIEPNFSRGSFGKQWDCGE